MLFMTRGAHSQSLAEPATMAKAAEVAAPPEPAVSPEASKPANLAAPPEPAVSPEASEPAEVAAPPEATVSPEASEPAEVAAPPELAVSPEASEPAEAPMLAEATALAEPYQCMVLIGMSGGKRRGNTGRPDDAGLRQGHAAGHVPDRHEGNGQGGDNGLSNTCCHSLSPLVARRLALVCDLCRQRRLSSLEATWTAGNRA